MTAKTSTTHVKATNKQLKPTFAPALKAGFSGGAAISLLLVVYQVSPPLLQRALIPPAMIIVWVVTGIGAAMLADDHGGQTSKDGSRIGLLSGLVAGTVSGITAMIIAAFGTSFAVAGQGVSAQFSDTQLAALSQSGFNETMLILTGGIVSAMVVCGVGGMVVSALLGWLGGWLYPKFNR